MTDNHAHEAFDHERTDVAPRWPIYIGIGMLLTLPITVAIVSALMSTIWAPPRHQPQAAQLAADIGAPAPNAPRLQTHPRADLVALQKKWDKRLQGTGWVDRDAGIAHIPIDAAEKRLLQAGLPQDTRMPPPSRIEGARAQSSDQRSKSDQRGKNARGDNRLARPRPERSSRGDENIGPEADSASDHAGNDMARPARNNAQRTPVVPYRRDRMQR